jgi:signal transduction histidine kinase
MARIMNGKGEDNELIGERTARDTLRALHNQEVDAIVGRTGLSYVRSRKDYDSERQNAMLLRDSDQHFRLALANSPVVLSEQDRDLRYTWIYNPKLGAAADAVIGKSDSEIMEPACAANIEALKRKVIELGVAIQQEVTVAAPGTLSDGYQYYDLVVEPRRDAAGQIIGVLCAMTDITAHRRESDRLREANAAAEQAKGAKSRFLAAVSHDLRQPLAALVIYTDVLRFRAGPGEQGVVASMRDCLQGLSALLDDLLDLSTLESGAVQANVTDFAISDVLSNIESVNTPIAQAKGLQLRCHTTPLMAHTDAVLFKRILGNLANNAITHTSRGGVLIACRRRQGKTWVEVWDTGVGIPSNKTVEIFDEFTQLGDGARTKGSGLGLAIAARSAALLGLEITVRSRTGRGSVFAIELPLSRSQIVAPSKARHAPAVQPLRIALVEDNPMVRAALVAGLQSLNHQVVAGANAATLFAELDQPPPDVIVSDYRLPAGQTGYDVIKAARERYGATLPAILITGDTDATLSRSPSEADILVLYKPIELDVLQSKLVQLSNELR